MAGKTIPFRLITPVAVAFEGDAELVIAVGTEGEEGILPSHAPFLTALRPGILRANVATGRSDSSLRRAKGFCRRYPIASSFSSMRHCNATPSISRRPVPTSKRRPGA
jgi:hypothetical protein